MQTFSRLFMLLTVVSLVGAQPVPRVRDDLRVSAGTLVCNHDKKLADAWQLAIYDVLLAIKLVKTTASLDQQALNYATQTGNFGYTYGKCQPKGPTWLLTVSAPYRLRIGKGYFEFAAELSNYCREFATMYAANGLSLPKPVTITNRRVLLPKKGNGVVALSCRTPPKGSKHGARLFYAVPIGKPTDKLIMNKQLIGNDRSAVVKWLTSVRKALGRPAVTLRQLNNSTTTRFTVHHDRKELANLNKKLKTHTLLGENRVRAYSLSEALAMLWLSPFHRQLLVDKRARYIDVAINYRAGQVLVVILVAS